MVHITVSIHSSRFHHHEQASRTFIPLSSSTASPEMLDAEEHGHVHTRTHTHTRARQTNRQKHTYRHIEKQAHMHIDRHTGTHRDTDIHTYSYIDAQYTHIHMYTSIYMYTYADRYPHILFCRLSGCIMVLVLLRTGSSRSMGS